MSDNVINKINIGGSTYDIIGVPDGGTVGQVLTKNSETDYDVSWEDAEGGGITPITYSELVDLRDNGELIPGMQYRITDYTCTTSQINTQSAGHVFDIIVTADDTSTLNENARAAHHSGDTYFQNCNLEAWELKYSLDNDTSRFAWASDEDKEIITPTPDSYIEIQDTETTYDFYFRKVTTTEMSGNRVEVWLYYCEDKDWYAITLPNPSQGDTTYTFWGDIDDPDDTDDFEITNLYTQTTTTIIPKGTGVIYYMKDEWNNEAPYDFKNIQYKRYAVNASYDSSSIYNGLVYVGYDANNNAKGASTSSTSNINNVQPYYYIPNYNNCLSNIEINYNNYKWVYTTNGCYISDDDGGSIEYYDMSATPKTFTFVPEQVEPARKGNTRGENDSESETVTISDIVRDNIIKPYIVDGKMVLNNIVSFSKSYMYESSGGNLAKGGAKFPEDDYNNAQASTCFGNTFGYDCHDCTIGGFYNKIGNNCYDIILSDQSKDNTIQNNCYNITINRESEQNSFDINCSGIVLNNSSGNTFGLENRNIKLNNCVCNTFGKNCEDIFSYENDVSGNNHNTIGDNGYRIYFYTSWNEHNTIGDNCREIMFSSDSDSGNYSGDHNSHNILGDYCSGTFYGGCKGNIIGSGRGNGSNYYEYNIFILYYGCENNIIGNSCNIRLGIYSSNNYIGNNVCISDCGNYCIGNSIGNNSVIYFGDYCKNNSIDNNNNYLTLNNYCENIHIFDGVSYCTITGGTNNSKVQNAQVLSGTSGTSYDNLLTITFEANKNYTQIAGLVNGTTLRIWIAEDTVTGPSTATNNHIAVFNGTTGKIIKDSGITISDLSPDLCTSTTYSALKTLRDGGNLVPGMQYRITDYECTTSQKDTQATNHAFDIIVTADDASHLNENARACHHTGDTYFQNCNLDAWELKYCLDNDTNRFDWACKNGDISRNSYIECDIYDSPYRFYFSKITTAKINNTQSTVWLYYVDKIDCEYCAVTYPNPSIGDTIYICTTGETGLINPYLEFETYEITNINTNTVTSGKGIIYYMKDEWNNECSYDFKNIQFKRYEVTNIPTSYTNYYNPFGSGFVYNSDVNSYDGSVYYFGIKYNLYNKGDLTKEYGFYKVIETPRNFDIDFSNFK